MTKENTMVTLAEVFAEARAEEQKLTFRYPWFNVVYNYLVAAVMFALIVSLTVWGLNVRTRQKAEEMTATARAAWEAERDAAVQAEAEELAAARASQEYVMQKEAEALARAFYGIRNFVEKYHYDSADLETYARAAFNRVDAGNGVNSLEAIISRPEQFLAYDPANPVLDEYYTLALELVEKWHAETTKPCGFDYQYAELTPDGIYLKNDIHADGYSRRYHA